MLIYPLSETLSGFPYIDRSFFTTEYSRNIPISTDFQLLSKVSKGTGNPQFISIICNLSGLYAILKTKVFYAVSK